MQVQLYHLLNPIATALITTSYNVNIIGNIDKRSIENVDTMLHMWKHLDENGP